ncbi:heme lyase CcmF/NrfE family subunit [Aquabacterium sp. OR-4]|uniref:heme lyase CcmF/NrfE family subunit n=1 Tax=Aquabacterium sp. OR-4 TaxID=2978127 RepID=UPI0028CAD661|nr:heme lyase NrfEFG subunit NrfE [Aquabacterium sp. OR-4]MDT7838709.1 heme lyase NrfEFG subunit NrfE [Aquabacterium sp. OR-4]
MTGELGQLALVLAFAAAALQALAGLAPAAWGAPPRLAAAALRVQALAVAGAFVALAAAFAQRDFSLVYVAQHSNAQLPLVYRLAAVWGGHEGSMLLWALVLAGWSLLAAPVLQRRDAALARSSVGVLGAVSVAMLGFVLLASNPFLRLLPAAQDGQDLNPMLQDPGLVFHPPLLYLGYVGTVVPFAVVIARLLRPTADEAWVRLLRPFVLAALACLTLGIALGSWWAYYELGWGGWWFWDPVENASLMPWLALAALLHVLPAREQRGSFALWTGVLAVAAFALSLVGTFLVRSGVLTSVHAFASDPRRGVWMLAMVAATLLVATALLGTQAARLAARRAPGPWTLASREAGLALAGALLMAACGSVLLGTLYPLAIDALQAGKLSVGAPYFDAVLQPLLLPLLALAGLAPWLRWGGARLRRDGTTQAAQAPHTAKRPQQAWHTRLPRPALAGLALALTGVALAWLLQARFGQVRPAVWLTLCLAGWLAGATLAHALPRLGRLGASAWGMTIAHLGVAVFAAGVAMVNGHGQERDATLAPGEQTRLGDCLLRFDGVRPLPGANYDALRGRFTLQCPGQAALALQPEKRAYPGAAMPTSESAIVPGLWRDLYVALGEPVLPAGAAGLTAGRATATQADALVLRQAPWTLRLQVKPLMRWVWAGALLMALGAAIAALARRYRQPLPRPGAAPHAALPTRRPHTWAGDPT